MSRLDYEGKVAVHTDHKSIETTLANLLAWKCPNCDLVVKLGTTHRDEGKFDEMIVHLM